MILVLTAILIIVPKVIQADCPFNGQCVYNINVDHCASSTGSTSRQSLRSASGCACSDVSQAEGDIDELKAEIQSLNNKFSEVSQQLKSTVQQLKENNYTLNTLQTKNKHTEDNLNVINAEIDKDKHLIESESLKWTSEVTRLHTAISDTEKMKETCKNALSAAQSSLSHGTVDSGISKEYCDFENTYCGYTQDTNEQLDWTRYHSLTDNGPASDHTFGTPTGNFMALSGHSVSTSSSGTKIARITSSLHSPSASYCLKFWYFMHGSDVKTLKVYAKVGSGLGYPIFTQVGQIDSSWHMQEIDVDPEFTANSFQVVFEATTDAKRVSVYSGGHYTHRYDYADSSIAIDDIYLYNTSCANTKVQCSSGDLIWHDGHHISCYHFFLAPLSWREAGEACRNFSTSAHLVSINKAEEHQFLVQTIQANSTLMAVGSNGYYTSGNDLKTEGHFQWTDTGSPYDFSYTNWHSGQPNNVGSDQDCVSLEYGNTFEWGDVQCDSKHPYICEINN